MKHFPVRREWQLRAGEPPEREFTMPPPKLAMQISLLANKIGRDLDREWRMA